MQKRELPEQFLNLAIAAHRQCQNSRHRGLKLNVFTLSSTLFSRPGISPLALEIPNVTVGCSHSVAFCLLQGPCYSNRRCCRSITLRCSSVLWPLWPGKGEGWGFNPRRLQPISARCVSPPTNERPGLPS